MSRSPKFNLLCQIKFLMLCASVATNPPKAPNDYICRMQVDYLIIGQGLSGTWLSYYLEKAGQSFLVIDKENRYSASRVAAGIVNPVTGRRIVKTWMIDELLPFTWEQYQMLGEELEMEAIARKNIVDFFPSPQMKLAFDDRLAEHLPYLSKPENENKWRDFFNYDFGAGEIQPCYLVNLPVLLPAYRKRLIENNQIVEAHFDITQLSFANNHIHYENISARKIIFCNGTGANEYPHFGLLPYAPNKGEILLVKIPGLPPGNIYKKGLNLVPWREDIFWVGSSYEWSFNDNEPTASFRQKTEAIMKAWLKIPFTIVDHLAAVRPATLERRPFVGIHPNHPGIAILNGMGTKGCSLAPYFARQLVNHLVNNEPLHPEADINRFKRLLTKEV